MAGRPHNCLQIVDTFLQPHEIIAMMPDLLTHGGELNKQSILLWLAERRLLANSVNCPHCNMEHINFIVRKPRGDLTHH